MSWKDFYKKRLFRRWQKVKYEKTGNDIYFWLSVFMDVLIIAFAIYFITHSKDILMECINRLEMLNPALKTFNPETLIHTENITKGLQ